MAVGAPLLPSHRVRGARAGADHGHVLRREAQHPGGRAPCGAERRRSGDSARVVAGAREGPSHLRDRLPRLVPHVRRAGGALAGRPRASGDPPAGDGAAQPRVRVAHALRGGLPRVRAGAPRAGGGGSGAGGSRAGAGDRSRDGEPLRGVHGPADRGAAPARQRPGGRRAAGARGGAAPREGGRVRQHARLAARGDGAALRPRAGGGHRGGVCAGPHSPAWARAREPPGRGRGLAVAGQGLYARPVQRAAGRRAAAVRRQSAAEAPGAAQGNGRPGRPRRP